MRIPDYCSHSEDGIHGFFGDYRWLSNFWPARIDYLGFKFNNVESAYQAAKGYPDVDWMEKFTNTNGFEAKKIGKSYKNLPKNWDKKKFEVMVRCVFSKFFDNPELGQKLLNTENIYLEETNNWGDHVWGVSPMKIGENKLGEIIMSVRELLRICHEES